VVRLRDVQANKVPVSVRLDPEVLAWLKAKGEGHDPHQRHSAEFDGSGATDALILVVLR
jgi:hypothetical protein